MDWCDLSWWCYYQASKNNAALAAYLTYELICRLMERFGCADPNSAEFRKFLGRVSLAAHSLGAHIAGKVGHLFNSYVLQKLGKVEKLLGAIYGKRSKL